MSNTKIICHDLPNCPVCDTKGTSLYTDQKDTLFTAPGTWNLSQCSNDKCNTCWLNPAPITEEIVKLYDTYSTHSTPTQPAINKKSLVRKMAEMVRQNILSEYGYQNNLPKYIRPFLTFVSYLHPGWRNSQLNQILYVPFVQDGHLLDVGCGNGNAMTRFKERGFKVTGTDFDPKAIAEAKDNGLDVHLGDLQEISFPENTFDVVFLSHVIEHVPNPIEALAEYYRILKPGGYLIAVTPNANSLSHKKFKEHWRGLEIPRHLQIFTPASLANAAKKAGFKKVEGKTCLQGIHYLWDASKNHQATGSFDIPTPSKLKRLKDQIRLFTAGIRFTFAPGQEETILLQCQK
jgi:2-polyprenyl-3-methyl-5-hydroxy-6-metoxy-1,4-benzoquinol methylase